MAERELHPTLKPKVACSSRCAILRRQAAFRICPTLILTHWWLIISIAYGVSLTGRPPWMVDIERRLARDCEPYRQLRDLPDVEGGGLGETRPTREEPKTRGKRVDILCLTDQNRYCVFGNPLNTVPY
jgi:hypothetical protein